VNQHDVDLVVEGLVEREIGAFRRIWDESSLQEQAVLAALVSLRGARGVATAQEVRTSLIKAGARLQRGQATVALEHLAERGILERLGAHSYRFRVALLRDWLVRRVDLGEAVRGIRWDDRDAGRSSQEQPIVKLRFGKGRRPKRRTDTEREAQDGAAEEAVTPILRRRGWWVGLGAVIVVLLLVTLRPVLVSPPSDQVTPTLLLAASPTVRLPTATLTTAVRTTSEPAGVTPATATATATLAATVTPTRPVVVSRPLPSIAYLSRGSGEQQWSIYVMNSDGSNRLRLAGVQAEFLSAPSWSPGGASIAFVSGQAGSLDIWVMSSDGGDLTNLTQHPEKDHSPAWSPDGEWIAFASVRDALYWEIYVMQADGSNVQRLTWWEDASDLSPSWSPDGTRLAFASKRDGNWEIYVMDRDGANLVRLTNHPADDTDPAWSPDGSRIAFESTRDGFTDIFVMGTIGGEAVNLTNLAWATDLGPTWSPDGSRIAFYSDRDGDWDIYVMASDGSDVTKLTGDATNDQVPAWRP
jgi:Tol biopolymer transport system component